jgi:hypothetical protein
MKTEDIIIEQTIESLNNGTFVENILGWYEKRENVAPKMYAKVAIQSSCERLIAVIKYQQEKYNELSKQLNK